MNDNRFAMYAVAALAGVAIAIMAGVPGYYLILLACPAMMFFTMSSMSGGGPGRGHDDASSRGEPAESKKTRTTP